jgi:hypothetical protein
MVKVKASENNRGRKENQFKKISRKTKSQTINEDSK